MTGILLPAASIAAARRGLMLVAHLLALQTASLCQSPSAEPAKRPEVTKIELSGNASFDNSVLKDVLSLKETPGGFSKFLYRTVGEKLGSRPEYFSLDKFDADLKRLKRFYQDHGFYEAEVNGEYHDEANGEEVVVRFAVEERQRSVVDSVRYLGFDDLPLDVTNEIFKAPLLEKGMPYEVERGGAEVARVLGILSNNGYPGALFDGENSAAFHRVASHTFLLTYVFRPGKRQQFGDITIRVDPPRDDITDNLTLRMLDFQPGDTYSRSKKISSESNLNRLGLFESARIDHGVAADSGAGERVPIDILVHPRPRNEISPEIIVSDENNAFNLGVGLGYTNRNFIGDARTFSTRVRGRTQSIRELFEGRGFRDATVVGALDIDFQILQPYFFTRSLSGSWTSTISFEKQNQYILSILRNRIGLSNRFATYTTGFIDWTLERVSPEFLVSSAALDYVARQPQEKQRQFNSILTLTLQRDKTNDVFSPTEGFFNSMVLEESGLLPKLFPGAVSGLPYTQYYKATLFGRWYQDISSSRFNIFALKLKSGYQDKYGESRNLPVSIPLNRRFFAGGSGSVRGWRARELGAMGDELLPFGGNFIFEGNAELRVNHFRGFGKVGFIKMENIWGVYFLDFGNVWADIGDFRARDVAVAAGIGIRYDTFFGPFRIDYGFRVYDPKENPDRQTIFRKKFFSETLSSAIIHFGLGHSF